MKMIRMYTGADKRTRFEEMDPKLASPTQGSGRAAAQMTHLPAVTGQPLYRIVTAPDPSFHRAPQRNLITVLEGIVHLVSGTGESATLGPGDIFQAEDLEGDGHVVRFAPGTTRYTFLVLTLADQAPRR